jgi:hypothetical protein
MVIMEYHVEVDEQIFPSEHTFAHYLNTMSEEGWEYVCTTPNARHVFRRPRKMDA